MLTEYYKFTRLTETDINFNGFKLYCWHTQPSLLVVREVDCCLLLGALRLSRTVIIAPRKLLTTYSKFPRPCEESLENTANWSLIDSQMPIENDKKKVERCRSRSGLQRPSSCERVNRKTLHSSGFFQKQKVAFSCQQQFFIRFWSFSVLKIELVHL